MEVQGCRVSGFLWPAPSPFPSWQVEISILGSEIQQGAKERELQELGEQQEQLTEVQEALLQDHVCLGVPLDHLLGQDEALMDEHSCPKILLCGSLEM